MHLNHIQGFPLPASSLAVFLFQKSSLAYFSKSSRKCKCPCLWSRAKQSHSCLHRLQLKLPLSFFCQSLLNILFKNCASRHPFREILAYCPFLLQSTRLILRAQRISLVSWSWIQILTPSPTFWVSLGKLQNCPKPQLPNLY